MFVFQIAKAKKHADKKMRMPLSSIEVLADEATRQRTIVQRVRAKHCKIENSS